MGGKPDLLNTNLSKACLTMHCAVAYSLREVVAEDKELLFSWHNAHHVVSTSFSEQTIALESADIWFSSVRNAKHAKSLMFEAAGQPAGFVRLHQIHVMHGTACWSFLLGDTSPPRGTGTKMMALAAEHAFRICGVRKITAEILDTNSKSLHLHRKLGFRQEGLLRKHVCKQDGFHDVFLMALFAEDFDLNLLRTAT